MKRLLIIDDSAVVRKVAERILRDLEVEIDQASSGTAGLAVCRESRPDYILLDSMLPDHTSVEFLTALKDVYRGQMPMVLLMVNEMEIGPIMKAKRAGSSGHVLKPFNRSQLLTAFAKARDTAERRNATRAA
ncbi:MAG: response regulator [Notoacmeibacter sp.]|nr:response regulator [Notoacmeibacter sp.]